MEAFMEHFLYMLLDPPSRSSSETSFNFSDYETFDYFGDDSSFDFFDEHQQRPEPTALELVRMIECELECSTIVRQTASQTKPVYYMDRSKWYRVKCRLLNPETLPDRSMIRACFGLRLENPCIAEIRHLVFAKFASQHPHDNLLEVRLPNMADPIHPEEPIVDIVWFPLPAADERGEFSLDVRVNCVMTQFFFDEDRNHPLKMPFDFSLYFFAMIGDDRACEPLFFPIKVTWPERAGPLSTLIADRFQRYGSLRKPRSVRQQEPKPGANLTPIGCSSQKLECSINICSYPGDKLDSISYILRSVPITIKLRPLARFRSKCLYHSTILLQPHRSTEHSTNPLVRHVNYNHRFVIMYELSRLAESVYDVYYNSGENSIEVIWLPCKPIRVTFQFDWLGPTCDDVAAAMFQLVVKTAELFNETTVIERSECLVKFRDPNFKPEDYDYIPRCDTTYMTVFKRNRNRNHRYRANGNGRANQNRRGH